MTSRHPETIGAFDRTPTINYTTGPLPMRPKCKKCGTAQGPHYQKRTLELIERYCVNCLPTPKTPKKKK